MIETERGRLLGVLGAMGPLASAQFMTRLTLLTDADCDQAHVPAILWSDPRIPDRGPVLLGVPGAADPRPALLAAVRGLKAAGCGALAIPCNTVHGWADLLGSQGMELLHIVDAAGRDLAREVPPGSRIGIIGTTATLALKLYPAGLARYGHTFIEPTDEETAQLVMPAIDAVKGNRVAESFAPIAEVTRRLVARGADAVVLGCTELPISLLWGDRGAAALRAFGAPVIDTIDALCRASIAWSRGAAGHTRELAPMLQQA